MDNKVTDIIICVDGCELPDIEYPQANITMLHNEENMGIGYTRQVLVEEAHRKGFEYMFFISADDVLNQGYVKAMLNAIKDNDFAYSNYEVINEEGKVIGRFDAPEFEDYEEFRRLCYFYALRNSMFVCFNIFGRVKSFKKVGFREDLRFGEDLDFLLRSIFKYNMKYAFVKDYLFKYRFHRKQTTQEKRNMIAENNQKILKSIFG